MKKFAVLIAVVLVAALAAPALSATNPFMDVPMNHWAYDAIGQLAAHGILSGYPDGTYKGQLQTTRYELASALARSLAVVDMTKASKQDVEMLKRLVVEFKDELEALGVRVDELDERIAVYENRLGGWHLHGAIAPQLTYRSGNEAPDAKGAVDYDDAKIWLERTFGENDEYQFVARLNGGDYASDVAFDRFWIEMPFFFDSRMKLGRENYAWEGAYKVDLNATGSWGGDQLLTDWGFTGLGVTKNFGLGTTQFVVAHPDKYSDSDWMLMARAALQVNEQFGFDIGGQYFAGDNAETYKVTETTVKVNDNGTLEPDKIVRKDASGNVLHQEGDDSFNSLWTIFAGLHFNFNDNVAFKGIFYAQAKDAEEVVKNDAGNYVWKDAGYGLTDDKGEVVDSANHWAVMVDVKQPALKYTGLWLEYGMYDQGFTTRSDGGIFYSGSSVLPWAKAQAVVDTTYYRLALQQEWNEKWATHIFYYGYKLDKAKDGKDDASPFEVGAGVQYKFNDVTTMGLNFIHVDSDIDAPAGSDIETDDNIVRFRTSVSF